ncbi:hypothetical protein [Streptomyces sp. V3I7]|uniref:hypothetical protein n=1 Tax=Streptomyces sp. V3I7 TaxID=3042278 RepID=UPI0027871CDE|nr:hypothetical protein [Streptomyces sp. V3I7]MDQ0990539.1 hypothetical protein [Streptomyces sp. V3I7]
MEPTAESAVMALSPVEHEPGVLAHSTADRRLAAEHWLLSSHGAPQRARLEWQEHKVALLPLGTLFSAVRIPGGLVFAIAGAEEPDEVDPFLEDALGSGPVICDPRGRRYYVLVPASMPHTWRQAADEWRTRLDVEVLGRATYLGVPRLNETDFDPSSCHSYWSVPMRSAAELCAPLRVARLLAVGQRAVAEDGQ